MLLKKIRPLAVPAILLILLLISILILTNSLMQRPSVQEYLVQRLSHLIGVDIRTGEIEVNLWGGIGILVHDFEARTRDGDEGIRSSRVRIILDGTELIKGRVVPKTVHLIQPIIETRLGDRPGSKKDQRTAETGESPLLWMPGIQSLLVEQGLISFKDHPLQLNDVDLEARRTSRYPLTLSLSSKGRIGFRDLEVPFDISGIMLLPSETGNPGVFDLLLKTGKASLERAPWPRSILVKDGDFESSLKIEGDLHKMISVNGQVEVEALRFILFSGDREKDFSIPRATIDFRSIIQDGRVDIQSLQIENQEFSISAGLSIDPKERQRPLLDLAVETGFMNIETFNDLFPSPLLPLWLEERLLPVLTSGQVRLKLLDLKGSREQLLRLDRPENRSALRVELECQDLDISGDGIPMPFTGVAAGITIGDGDIGISGLKAKFGDSVIRDAGLLVKGIIGDSPSFEISMDGSFDLEDLIRQKEMEFITSGFVIGPNRQPGLTGRLECKARFGYGTDWGSPRILSGKFLFRDCRLKRDKLLLPLNVKEAEFRIHESGLNGFTGLGSWGNSPFRIMGEFSLKGMDLDFSKTDISLNMDLNEVIQNIHKDAGLYVRSREPTVWRVSMTKDGPNWDCRGDIELNNVVMESEGFYIEPQGIDNRILFDLRFRPREMIRMNSLLCSLGDSTVKISGDYDFHDNTFSGLDISSSGLSMEDLGIYNKSKDIPMTGSLKGGVDISLPELNIKEADIDGRIEGEDLCLGLKIGSAPVEDCRFHLDLSGKEVSINDLKMKIGESLLLITGRLTRGDNPEGDIVVKSDFLNISDILSVQHRSELSGSGRGEGKGFLNGLDLGIKVYAREGLWRKLRYGPMEAELNIEAGDIHINRAMVNLEKGLLRMNGRIVKGTKPETLFSGYIRLVNQPIDELLEGIGIKDKGLKGSLTMEGPFLIQGKDREDLIAGMTGFGNISLRKGLIKRSRVFIKVLEFLSIQKIFKQRPPDLREEGFYFESMAGDLFIEKGVLRSDNIVIKSPVFNAVAYGEMDIPANRMDFILATQPHGTIDTLVSNIPILGYIITGEKGSVLAYPFEVSGPVSDPQVRFTPFEKLGKGVGGIFKRLLLTPKRILDDIGEVSRARE